LRSLAPLQPGPTPSVHESAALTHTSGRQTMPHGPGDPIRLGRYVRALWARI
jgi:hypothetical protein